jgi:Mg2+-importing ATPase
MNQYPTHLFWNKPATFWMNHFQTNETGYSKEQAALLSKSYKPKAVTENSLITELKIFLGQFKSPLMLLLIAAVLLSAFLGDTSDVFIILFIVLSTGILSYFQERNAQNIVKKLQSLLAHQCVVFRNGKAFEIPSEELLPGDIVLFSAGNLIPADCLIMDCNELHVNESSLTGESFPVRKHTESTATESSLSQRNNCLWMGTNVISGTAKAIVIHTNEQTLFNQIVVRSHVNMPTSFEKGINDFGLFLMKITLVLALFIFCVNMYFHQNLFDAGLFALALAVGMAPELLPAITTIAMSAGAKRLLAKKVIVKKLNAIQNLGEINLLCTDKTGTLTAGNIAIHEIVNAWGIPDKTIEQFACWNACLEGGYSNPIDDALKKHFANSNALPIKIAELPYDFNRKRLSVLVQQSDCNLIVTKGAFNEIIDICSQVKNKSEQVESISEHLANIKNLFEQFASKGFRVIAVSYKAYSSTHLTISDEKNMVFGGFVLLSDPVKDGIQNTLDQLKELGIGLKIITGDNELVAHALGTQLGIENPKVLSGNKLTDADPAAIPMLVNEHQIFAEIDPQQKEQIILALKHQHSVAYMGDGINDVAALHAADIGISVDNAVDIAKEAADFVLLEKNLNVLIEGIKEGRKTFANTLKYIFINTGSTFGNMFSVAGASLLLPFLPMLPKQILLTNFITDFPYLSIASDNVDTQQLKKPGKWNIKTIRNYMVIFGLHSSIFDMLTFFILWKGLRVTEHDFQTAWFVESILTELFILFIIRTQQNFFKSLPGKWLFIMSGIGLLITVILPYLPVSESLGLVPLPIWQMGILIAIVTCYILTADLLKVWFFKSSLNKLTEK